MNKNGWISVDGMRTNFVDFDKEPELKRLFELTAESQEETKRVRDLPFENLLITI